MASTPQTESKLIVLTQLNTEIEEASKAMKKWVTVIDKEGNAEIFFKYQGTTYFSILEKEVDPQNLCRSLLTMAKYPRTLTINYLDLPYKEVFNEKYFPEDVIDMNWVHNFYNIEKLRQNFLEEFPEEVWPSADFKICFLFRKDNVPPIFYEKTHVLEICPPQEIGERLAEREEKRLAQEQEKKKVEEEKKVEEAKTASPAKPKTGAAATGKATTTTKTATATAKTTTSTAKTGTTAAKTGTTAPAKTVASVKTTTTASKTSSTTTKPAATKAK